MADMKVGAAPKTALSALDRQRRRLIGSIRNRKRRSKARLFLAASEVPFDDARLIRDANRIKLQPRLKAASPG